MQPQLLTVIKKEVLKQWSEEEWQRWWIEPKYDGARLIYHQGQFLSRTGKPLHNLGHIASAFNKYPTMTFDGEVYGDNWADTMSVARSSKTVKADNNLRFAIFDCMDYRSWALMDCGDAPLIQRRGWMPNFAGHIFVHTVSHVVVSNFTDFEYIHQQNLLSGCDGTVLKRHDSLYEFKRTKTWLKVKPVETFDCRVVGMKEGTGKYKGMLGALQIIPEGSDVDSWCSGMDDAQRLQWWNHPTQIHERIIEVEARGVHPSGCLIEPRFIRVREDK